MVTIENNELLIDRFKSRFDELPLIGKVPKYIRGSILKTIYGDIDLNELKYKNDAFCNILKWDNFFKKLKWYEEREFEIEEVECIKDNQVGAYKVFKGETYKVHKLNFYYSCGIECNIYEIIIEHKTSLVGVKDSVFIYYEANNFIPTKYKILTDKTL